MAQVIEYPLDKLASTEVYSLEQDPQGKVENKFTIAAVPYARGLVVNYGGVDTVLGVFVRGSRVFLIEVVTPRAAKASEADIEFTRRLVMIQAAKAPRAHEASQPWCTMARGGDRTRDARRGCGVYWRPVTPRMAPRSATTAPDQCVTSTDRAAEHHDR